MHSASRKHARNGVGVSRAAWDLGIQEAFLEGTWQCHQPERVPEMQDAQTVLVGGAAARVTYVV